MLTLKGRRRKVAPDTLAAQPKLRGRDPQKYSWLPPDAPLTGQQIALTIFSLIVAVAAVFAVAEFCGWAFMKAAS